MATKRVRLLGTGSYAPPKVLTNFDLEKMVDTSDEWIRARTGISERRIAEDGVASSDLAFEASKLALEDAGLKPADLDMIMVGTVTPDRLFPSTATTLQQKLGAGKIPAFDLSAACSGFIYGLSLSSGLILTGAASHILVIGVECLSKITDWTDRNTCVLFGDGAGAAVVGPTDEDRGILGIQLASDGSLGDLLEMPAGGSLLPASEETVRQRLHYTRMKGNDVFKNAVRAMSEVCLKTLEIAGKRASELDLLIPHQANLRIMEATAKRIGVPREKVFVNVDRYGNTSAASVPIGIDEARRSGQLSDGDLLEIVAFGGGFTWGASVIKW